MSMIEYINLALFPARLWLLVKQLFGCSAYECDFDRAIIDVSGRYLEQQEELLQEFQTRRRNFYAAAVNERKRVSRSRQMKFEAELIVERDKEIERLEAATRAKIRHLLVERTKAGFSSDWGTFQLQYGRRFPALMQIFVP